MNEIFGIVIDNVFYSNRMEFKVKDVMNGIYSVNTEQDDFKNSVNIADVDNAIKFFRKSSKIKVVRGITFHDGFIPENPVSFNKIPIKVLDATYDDYEEIEVAILPNSVCYFLRSISTVKAFPLIELRDSVEKDTIKLKDIKGVTPEMRIIYNFHLMEKKIIEDEKKRKEQLEPINAITNAMKIGGAEIHNIKKVNRGYEVTWSSEGYTLNTLLSNDYRVIEAGFCVSGYDKTQSSTSVVHLLKDYVRQGDHIHKTRTI